MASAFDKPVRAWAAGVTAETTRDVLQEKLIGPPFRLYFTQAEKAALEWAEALTRVEQTHAPDAAYEPLARHYDSKQVANITYAAYERLEPRRHRFPRGAQAPSRGAPFRVSAVQACYVSARGDLLDACKNRA